MADKIAELKVGDGQPLFEIKAFKPNDLIRGTFRVRLFNKTDTKSVVIGDSGDEVDNPQGSFNIPFENDIRDLDDRFIRFRVFVADDEDTDSGDWFLSIKIKQKNKTVSGGDITFKSNLDSIGFIGDKVRLNVT
jgi:hypothetical protein